MIGVELEVLREVGEMLYQLTLVATDAWVAIGAGIVGPLEDEIVWERSQNLLQVSGLVVSIELGDRFPNILAPSEGDCGERNVKDPA